MLSTTIFTGLLAWGQAFLLVAGWGADEDDGVGGFATLTSTIGTPLSVSLGSSQSTKPVFATASHPHVTTVMSGTTYTLDPFATALPSGGPSMSSQTRSPGSATSGQDPITPKLSTSSSVQSDIGTLPPGPPPASPSATTVSSSTISFLFPSPPPGFPPGFESSISSTMTVLPPGASIEVLPSGAYTQNTVRYAAGLSVWQGKMLMIRPDHNDYLSRQLNGYSCAGDCASRGLARDCKFPMAPFPTLCLFRL